MLISRRRYNSTGIIFCHQTGGPTTGWAYKREGITGFYGLAKLGNIVAETLLRVQMFCSLATQETLFAEANFASMTQENVFESSQKHFCFKDANVAYATYVS